MGFWDRKRQEREWGVEFKNVPTPELRRKMEGALYPSPDKQRFVEGLVRRRENLLARSAWISRPPLALCQCIAGTHFP